MAPATHAAEHEDRIPFARDGRPPGGSLPQAPSRQGRLADKLIEHEAGSGPSAGRRWNAKRMQTSLPVAWSWSKALTRSARVKSVILDTIKAERGRLSAPEQDLFRRALRVFVEAGDRDTVDPSSAAGWRSAGIASAVPPASTSHDGTRQRFEDVSRFRRPRSPGRPAAVVSGGHHGATVAAEGLYLASPVPLGAHLAQWADSVALWCASDRTLRESEPAGAAEAVRRAWRPRETRRGSRKAALNRVAGPARGRFSPSLSPPNCLAIH
jgi:hypothetical protein